VRVALMALTLLTGGSLASGVSRRLGAEPPDPQVPAAGQELARRVAGVGEGPVRLTYATREGVEICAQGIRMGGRRLMWRSRGWGDAGELDCRTGSAELELRIGDGGVREVEVLLGARNRTPGAVELGTVAAEEAVRLLLAIAREGRWERGARDAVFPIFLADVDGVWSDALALASDSSVPRGVRTSALFWVGQEAAEAATRGLAEVAFAPDEEQEVRDAAVFALSQQPGERAIPLLMELVRTAPHAQTRRSALFWLAQSHDERVPAFFEAILLGKGGR
jgi:hypothetical protein